MAFDELKQNYDDRTQQADIWWSKNSEASISDQLNSSVS